MSRQTTLADEVVRAVAASEGVEPESLEQRLFDAVDGDALERLCQRMSGHVTFEYAGYEVTVTGDGDISLAALNH